MATSTPHILLLEPFYGGSHKQLIDLLYTEIAGCDLYSTPAKKWHWKARTSALYFSQVIPTQHQYRVLFCCSVLNLAELIAIRPDLARIKKVVYFHENQLVYPVRKQLNRDFQYGYNQIITGLAADVVLFNSAYNMESFLTNIDSFLKLIPDHRPKCVAEMIRPKCQVVYFPIIFPDLRDHQSVSSEKICPDISENVDFELENVTCTRSRNIVEASGSSQDDVEKKKDKKCNISLKVNEEKSGMNKSAILSSKENMSKETETVHVADDLREESFISDNRDSQLLYKDDPLMIVWPHRWEHDKNAESLFTTLYRLKEDGLQFKLAVVGESYSDIPEIFGEAAEKLSSNIIVWGYQESKDDYYDVLRQADVVVSTAKHEFFGVAMLEAAYLRCYPLAPNNLVYPEIFPKDHLYNTDQQLYKRLREFCRRPQLVRRKQIQVDFTKYSWISLRKQFVDILSVKQIKVS